jgi:hypothetical protein
MTPSNVSKTHLLAALEEYDLVGRAAFLYKYGYGWTESFLLHDGKHYESKAVLGAALALDPELEDTGSASSLSGGESATERILRLHGFEVVKSPVLEVADDEGKVLDAKAELTCNARGWALTMSSQGGNARNPDYSDLLQTVLVRLGKCGATIEEIAVDSKPALKEPPSERILGMIFPKPLFDGIDVDQLRRRIQSLQTGVVQEAGASGGNSSKRIRIDFTITGTRGEIDVPALLAGPPPETDVTGEEAGARDYFGKIVEGASKTVTVNRFERNPAARSACIARHGSTCAVCGIDFGATYGVIGEGFIHVHHVVPISEVGGEYVINPITDLVPVCPNCHAMLHRGSAVPRSVSELQKIVTSMGTAARVGEV